MEEDVAEREPLLPLVVGGRRRYHDTLRVNHFSMTPPALLAAPIGPGFKLVGGHALRVAEQHNSMRCTPIRPSSLPKNATKDSGLREGEAKCCVEPEVTGRAAEC